MGKVYYYGERNIFEENTVGMNRNQKMPTRVEKQKSSRRTEEINYSN